MSLPVAGNSGGRQIFRQSVNITQRPINKGLAKGLCIFLNSKQSYSTQESHSTFRSLSKHPRGSIVLKLLRTTQHIENVLKGNVWRMSIEDITKKAALATVLFLSVFFGIV